VNPSWLCIACLSLATPALADTHYGPGVTDTEIRIGNTNPYSGNVSAAGQIGRAEAAYYEMINDKGGVNGRKITFLSLDDGYSPPKTVELTRQLVERDQVLMIAASLGTPTNLAIHRYLNQKQVPQLFVSSGDSRWADPQHFPWTMGWQPSYRIEGSVYAKHMLATVKDPKVAVLRQNDDLGLDFLNGFMQGLGPANQGTVIRIATYETTDPTVDSQMIELRSSGANVFFNIATQKFGALAIRKAGELDWHPTQYVISINASIGATIRPAGLANAQGIITADYKKDVTDPRWADDPEFVTWKAWMEKYNTAGNVADISNVIGYSIAFSVVQVLQMCGDDLTRENVMRQAESLHGLRVPMLLPGITLNTSPTDFRPIKSVHLQRFEGEHWVPFGELMTPDPD
jgi:branched-chain amino acid transport system substrate-binding protein